MSRILLEEQRTYEEMWAVEAYAKSSPGAQLVPVFIDMAHPALTDAVMDAGCGHGKGAIALLAAGFTSITCCDLVDVREPEAQQFAFHEICLWQAQALRGMGLDWVYCCDVLEHVPEALTMLSVHQLLEASRSGVFLNVSVVPDVFGAWAGRSLHQTVKPFTWWRDHLSEIGHVDEGRDFLDAASFLVTR